ncbi:hypothetical protein [Streptomyces gardneri]|uniref:Uncharacterized protein n=1 Tax=Streptomyces gardneri TaxID=66892 RepID=A0A4Y3RFX4_9ACTN|nr:hypothetical protein [Streptomyces gardneri]GEB56269.1 hypothetical protein SGA01_18740 [Streptomyces gardneri]GHG99471.1 hypothetical protein GCM10017674_34110 [Streptomyces gardneri]
MTPRAVRRIGRRADRAVSLLFLFLLAGIGARAGRPGRRKLRRIATSDEVRLKRERAERELWARAEEIGRTSPWGPAVRTTLVDTSARGGGRNHLDPHAPKQPALYCVLRLHLYFVVDRPAEDVLGDVRSGELLSWDVPGDDARARLQEPRPARRAVLGTCVSDPSDVTLAVLRERPGTLFAWTLSTMYHTVPGA